MKDSKTPTLSNEGQVVCLKHIYSTCEQYLQNTFWDWAESYKAYEYPLPGGLKSITFTTTLKLESLKESK
jgi:hypothetical protein